MKKNCKSSRFLKIVSFYNETIFIKNETNKQINECIYLEIRNRN